ncbi:major facilitator superfamily domain-containing protein [Tricladium varicosporioides]|nr:major facilitator superfamily domain-containing protein [Hymenoscyphus varicosporioides]
MNSRRSNKIIINVGNPLIGEAPARVEAAVLAFAEANGLMGIHPLLLTGAMISMNPEEFRDVPGLTTQQIAALERENTMTFWDQTKELRTTIFTCAIAAIVQGWDQSSINGANLRWPHDLGIHIGSPNGSDTGKSTRDLWIFALINAAPFLFGAICGSWLCDPFSFKGGRRFAICFSGIFCFFSTIGSAFVGTWQQLLACRVLLGIGMGAKASIVPVYAAEIVPAHIRGSVVMNWQVCDALGILLGFSANLAFYNITPLSWRLQLAAPCIPAIPLLCLIYTCPESPRFLIKRERFRDAYKSLLYLNETPLQAARDLYLIHAQNLAEIDSYNLRAAKRPAILQRQGAPNLVASAPANPLQDGIELGEITIHSREANGPAAARTLNPWRDLQEFWEAPGFWIKFYQLFTVQRMATSLLAAAVLMIAQQLCGVNVIAFYSSTIFSSGDTTGPRKELNALWVGWGFGLTNFLAAFPAYLIIDKGGRRPLLLATIPILAISLIAAAFSFKIPEGSKAHNPVIFLFVIIFTIFYSVGLGPAPFTYSAEVFPQGHREVGMSFAVFCNFLGAGILSLTVPFIIDKLPLTSLMGLFAGLNVVAWVLIFFLVYETKQAQLEEMRRIFSVTTIDYIKYQFFEGLPWIWRYIITLGQTPGIPPPYRFRRARNQANAP